jgi:type VI secretion system secreted protein Hcp
MATDGFIKIAGIEGESKDDKHAKEIDVLSWSWDAQQSGTTHMGGGSGAGKVKVGDLTFTKYIDSSSHNLLLSCCAGTHLKEAVLVVRKAGDKPLEYIKLTMSDVIVTKVATGGVGTEDRLTENITLNFGKFEFAYTPQKADGSGDAAKTAGWMIPENKKV